MRVVQVGGAALRLMPQRAACLEGEGTLLVADAHLGKAAAFGRMGVPVPEATTQGTLDRLDAAVQACAARRIVFLGDLLHSAHVQTAPAVHAAVRRWRQRRPELELLLVRGNHDRRAGDPPVDWGVQACDEPLRLGTLTLRHHPEPDPGGYVIAGHVHPGAVLGGRAHDRLRLPCFHFGPQVGLLPAFGEFTGLQVQPRQPGDRVFVIAGAAVRELPSG